MKKKYILLMLCVSIFLLAGCSKVNTDHFNHAKIIFNHDKISVVNDLEQEDVWTLKKIFQNKDWVNDNLSCGFSKDISICFDQEYYYCLAQDTCPYIYDWSSDKYFKVSEEEKEKIYEIFESLGGYFPCV